MNTLHIIFLETSSSSSPIDTIETIVNILTGLIVSVGGIGGVVFLKKIQEKKLNATFGYLSRLKVRIHFLKNTFDNYQDILLDRLIPVQNRRAVDLSKTPFIDGIIIQFSKTAEETLDFLKNEDNQIPAQDKWTEYYDDLLVFLEDFKNINNAAYYKFSSNDLESDKQTYSYVHSRNLESMLNSINKCQKELEHKMCKPSLYSKIKKQFK